MTLVMALPALVIGFLLVAPRVMPAVITLIAGVGGVGVGGGFRHMTSFGSLLLRRVPYTGPQQTAVLVSRTAEQARLGRHVKQAITPEVIEAELKVVGQAGDEVLKGTFTLTPTATKNAREVYDLAGRMARVEGGNANRAATSIPHQIMEVAASPGTDPRLSKAFAEALRSQGQPFVH